MMLIAMTNRPTIHVDMKIPGAAHFCRLRRFKEQDSYCYCSSFLFGGCHA